MNKTKNEIINEFRKLVIENPNLPIRFFVGEDAWCGEWAYNEAFITSVSISETVCYEEEYIEFEDYEDELYERLADEYQNDDHLKEAVEKILSETKTETAICVRID